MLKVGLTGGIASGKSTVARLFADHGCPMIDADLISREVVQKDSPGLLAVRAAFGPSVLTSSGELDRKALRERVFSDPAQRKILESILHPLIRARSDELEQQARSRGCPYLIFETPLLLETGRHRDMDTVLVVDVPEQLQIERVMQRDECNAEQATKILAAQTTREARLEIADDVITNTGSLQELEDAVHGLHLKYSALAGKQGKGEKTQL